MRAIVVLVGLTAGCSLPFDDFTPLPGDAAVDSSSVDAKPDSVQTDVATDACTCVKMVGGKCREWSPPGCM